MATVHTIGGQTFTIPPRGKLPQSQSLHDILLGTRIGDSTVMDEEINPNYEPTQDEILGPFSSF